MDIDTALAEVLQQWGMIVIPANLNCWGFEYYSLTPKNFGMFREFRKKRNKSSECENASQSPVIACLVWTAV